MCACVCVPVHRVVCMFYPSFLSGPDSQKWVCRCVLDIGQESNEGGGCVGSCYNTGSYVVVQGSRTHGFLSIALYARLCTSRKRGQTLDRVGETHVHPHDRECGEEAISTTYCTYVACLLYSIHRIYLAYSLLELQTELLL